MKPTTTEAPDAISRHPLARRLAVRVGWFVGIWAASVGVLAGVAYLLRKIIRG
jgi:hypothetical protein